MKLIFNGCSKTYGEGFLDEDRIKYCYPYLAQKFFGCEVENIASGGSSNSLIFERTADHMHRQKDNIHIVQWSELSRIWLFPDADLKIHTSIHNDSIKEIAQRLGIESKKLKEFCDMLLFTNGDYHNLLQLITYCNALANIAKSTDNKIIFVDGMLTLPRDLFDYTQSLSDLSEFTKQVIRFDARPDEELWKLYNKLYYSFKELDIELWANLFNSFKGSSVDLGPLGHHPGIKSHQIFFNLLKDKISKMYE